jgi:hypothetical protein
VEGNFVAMGVGEDFKQVWKTTFKTTTCGKFGIQLACGIEGVSHGEACAWFEGAQNFASGLTYNKRQFAPFDNYRILLQCPEIKGD